MRRLLQSTVWMLIGFAAAFCGCSRSQSAAASPSTAAAALSSETTHASLDLAYDKPAVVGASVHATVAGLPPGKTVDLTWGTVTGGWVIQDYYHFRGKKYSETTATMGQFPVDSSGRFDARFAIPEDYGGVHEVIALINGKPVAQNGINVTQTFELAPMSGPVGTLIELKVKGLGWRTMESTWVVNWDNHAAGWVSAAGTRGSAVARFRAVPHDARWNRARSVRRTLPATGDPEDRSAGRKCEACPHAAAGCRGNARTPSR